MTTITTVEGDELDDLVAQHYGDEAVSVALAAVWKANLGLAGLGIRIPAGTRVVLPDLLQPTVRRTDLWT